MPVEIVFFDAAGTLFRLRRPVGEIYGCWAARFGWRAGRERETQERLRRVFLTAFRRRAPLVVPARFRGGLREQERRWWWELVEEVFRPMEPFDRLHEFFDALFEFFQTEGAWKLQAGCRRTLARLAAQGRRLAVISNFDSRLPELLEALGIRSHFEAVIFSSAAPAAKPDPRIFRHALEQMGGRPERALHVGDHPEEDFRAARAAGLAALLYDPRRRFANRVPENRVKSLAEIPLRLL